MTELNKLYLNNVISDLLRHKIITGFCVILCTALCLLTGYSKVTDKEEFTEYNTRLEEYDTIIADVKEGLLAAEKQVEEMQEYVDESIYMRLDGQNIQIASVQYAIVTEPDSNVNVGNVLNALIYYTNEGGLRESVEDSNDELEVKYWRDVVSCSTGGNIFNVTIMHYDAEKAGRILEIVKERLQKQSSVIAEAQGSFKLQEVGSSSYVRADVNVTNTQNNHLNTLKGYISNRADFTSRLMSNENGKMAYIKDNMPVHLSVDPSGAMVTLLFHLIGGLLLGFALPFGLFLLWNGLQRRLRSDEDMKVFGLHTIGCCHTEANQDEALQRGLVELKYFVENRSLPSVFFNILSNDSKVKNMADNYQSILKKDNICLETGWQLQKDAAELQDMIAAGACVLVVQVGKTTYTQIEKQIEVCRTFHVDILGCIVVA